jgi:hypothetical protein
MMQQTMLRIAADHPKTLGGLMSILTSIALGLVLLVADLEAFGAVRAAVVALCHLFLVPSFGLVLLFVGWRKQRRRLQALGAAMLVAAISSVVVSSLLVGRQEAESQLLGDRVCKALESWRVSHGNYPASLQDLVPAAFAEPPVTQMGVFSSIPFRYSIDRSGDDYTLSFDSTAFMFFYRRATTMWQRDD